MLLSALTLASKCLNSSDLSALTLAPLSLSALTLAQDLKSKCFNSSSRALVTAELDLRHFFFFDRALFFKKKV